MTTLEIVLIILLWLIVGLFICHKRNWYKEVDDSAWFCFFSVVLTPLSFIVSFIRVYCVDAWDKY